MKYLYLLLLVTTHYLSIAQMTTQINGKPYNDECAEIAYEKIIDLDSLTTDPFDILKISIEDDCLLLSVSYVGGCGKTDFRLITNNHATESMHPTIEMFLQLEDEDMCEAKKFTTLRFDLKSHKHSQTKNGLQIRIINSETGINYLSK